VLTRKIVLHGVIGGLIWGILAISGSQVESQTSGPNLILFHRNAASSPGTCVGCHGTKIGEPTLSSGIKTPHTIHLTASVLRFGCTECHVSVDLRERSAASVRRQVNMEICARCHSRAHNADHERYLSRNCFDCHGRFHTTNKVPPYVNTAKITVKDCILCHGGKVLFARSRIPTSPLRGNISGTVKLATDGRMVSGMTIEVVKNGKVIAVGTSGPPVTAEGDTYNYRILGVEASTVTVRIANPGNTDVTRTVAVAPRAEVKHVDLRVKPLYTFPAGYSEIAVPYDYSQATVEDAANVLNVPAADLKLATWAAQRWVYYANPPADRFYLGQGYAISLPKPLPFVVSGDITPAMVTVSLTAGWNMIGNPHTGTVSWATVKVRLANGTLLSMTEAQRRNIIARILWHYDPLQRRYLRTIQLKPFEGYWIYAYRGCSLVVARP